MGGGGLILTLTRAQVAAIEAHAKETFPEECCGFILGSGKEALRVTSVRRGRNVAASDRERRYVVDPMQQLALEKELSETGEGLLGFYHSHPDHPAEPSEFDRSHAVPWYALYVIQGIEGGEPAALRAWIFEPETSRFREDSLRIEES